MDNNLKIIPTKVEEIPPKSVPGILAVALGIILIFPLSIFGFFAFIIPGIALFLLGIGAIVDGIQIMKGRIRLTCPYCGKIRVLPKSKTASKCPSCKKTGIIKNGYLNPLD